MLQASRSKYLGPKVRPRLVVKDRSDMFVKLWISFLVYTENLCHRESHLVLIPEQLSCLKICFRVMCCYFGDELSLLQLVLLLPHRRMVRPPDHFRPLLALVGPQGHLDPTDPHLFKSGIMS